ncbi:hypothetical protein Hanom_Chr09g00802181 [Helianthus anomalus]
MTICNYYLITLFYFVDCSCMYKILSKLQVLSFMFTSNCRRCPLAQKLTNFVLNVSKSCTLCPLNLTQLDFFLLSFVICLAHESIFVISPFQRLFCKEILFKDYCVPNLYYIYLYMLVPPIITQPPPPYHHLSPLTPTTIQNPSLKPQATTQFLFFLLLLFT